MMSCDPHMTQPELFSPGVHVTTKEKACNMTFPQMK